jgi:Fur family ferric uptake transcriptional regulator
MTADELPQGVQVGAALLRIHGLRVTPQRLVVLEVLQRAQGHLSVEEIHAQVRVQHPALSAVTVYRVLETLEGHGLVARGVLGDRLVRWELVAGAHHHLVCRHCAAIVELGDEPFQRLASDLTASYGIQVNLRHLALEGLCAACAEADGGEARSGEDSGIGL